MSRFVLMLFTALILSAPPVLAVEVTDGWMRALPPGQPTAAAYLTLTNPGSSGLRLLAARSPVADRVEIHQSSQEDGMWRMRKLDSLEIPPGGSVTLAPGGIHLMLMGLGAPLREGDELTVTLEFDNGESLPARIAVQAPGAGHHHHHQH